MYCMYCLLLIHLGHASCPVRCSVCLNLAWLLRLGSCDAKALLAMYMRKAAIEGSASTPNVSNLPVQYIPASE